MLKDSGNDALWGWFGLSRASFLTMPRVLMHEMPDEWQGKMAALLQEYDEAFDFNGLPSGFGTRVIATVAGKFTTMPDWISNYRHPDCRTINALARRVHRTRAP